MKNIIFLLALFCLITVSKKVFAQENNTGIFEGKTDVGFTIKPGNTIYNSQTQEYTISGSGDNIWADQDEFHFIWKKMKGDFILHARAEFAGSGGNEHRKLGWMVRKTLDANSPHIIATEHGSGLTSLQFRKTVGAQTEEIKMKIDRANVLQLERKDHRFIMRAAMFGDTFETDTTSIDLGDEVYVGLFVCAHDSSVLETGIFNNVTITVPFKGEADNTTQMKLGSNLELLDVATGKREIIYNVPYSIQGPNWSKDGNTIIYNGSDGLMYNFDLATRKATQLNTGDVKNNNNDHVLSFDGNMIGLSSNVKELGGSIIYTVDTKGGTPKQVTPKGPSYLHGWSPDGKHLVFCGERNSEYDVYRVPVNGGTEERLTTTKGLDDGPEYTPDGNYIYFNSVRSGLMQVWRMKPDGSNQEQVTNDSLNNWFAHISPDGKWLVFLSFLKSEVSPGAHPPYKHVYLRLMPVNGGEPKVIAYVYGGQGSINVPSWSPDSKRIAFVSNTNMQTVQQ